jgi:hypothetical membrane protein
MISESGLPRFRIGLGYLTLSQGHGMKRSERLLFGPVSAAIFCVGVAGLALMVPDYSHVHQTVSEIGEVGSPARIPFTVMLACVCVCTLIFASAIRDFATQAGRSRVVAYLTVCSGLSALGVGIFAYPHPLHNVFGLSEIIGYQAPLALALAWRSDPNAKALVVSSWVLFALLWIAMALNLSPLFPQSWLWQHLKPVNGLVQRSLFLSWFAWCTIAGVLMWRQERGSLPSR